MRALLLLATASAFACGGTHDLPDVSRLPITAYAYPGCPQTVMCEATTLSCALNKIAAKHGQCSVASDCTDTPWPRTTQGGAFCASLAPLYVRASEEQDFQSEARVELAKYCAIESCPRTVFDYAPARPVDCVGGVCTPVSN